MVTKTNLLAYTFISFCLCGLLSGCATSPTGRSQLIIVPESYAIDASESAYQQQIGEYAEKGRVDNDPALRKRVDRITSRLVAQAITMRPDTEGWAWCMKILDAPKTVNAWAMAGGKMALYTGLVKAIRPTDDELAQVLAHEIAHALAKHSAEKMSTTLATQVGVLALGIATESPATMAAAQSAATVAITLPYSRSAESEADRIGIELAAKAGYDPRAAATLWKKMGEQSEGNAPPEFLSTHPSPESRQETLSALAPQMMPFFHQAKQNPSPTHQMPSC